MPAIDRSSLPVRKIGISSRQARLKKIPNPRHSSADPTRWQASLRELAWQIFCLYRAHPWALDVPPSGPRRPREQARLAADDDLTTVIAYTDEDFEFGLARITAGLAELNGPP